MRVEKEPNKATPKTMHIAVVGSPGSGKTQLIDELYSRSAEHPNASVMLGPKRSAINEVSWTSRNELSHRLKNANVVLITVDLSRPDELENLKNRLSEHTNILTKTTPKIIIVGTNGDVLDLKERQEYSV